MTRTLKTVPALLAVLMLALPAAAKPKAGGKTQVEIQVSPATAQLFIDNKPQGKVGTNRVIDITPGFHVVKVTNKGDEHEERVKFAGGEKTTYSFEFDVAPPKAADEVQDPVSPDSPNNKEEPPPDPLKPQ